MTITVDGFQLTGLTGATGVEINSPVTFYVTGLEYDGNDLNNNHLAYVTGYGIFGSGTIGTEVSGSFYYDPDNSRWETNVTISDGGEAGNTATGCLEFEYNSGADTDSYNDNPSGLEIVANKNQQTWNTLTFDDGVLNNADGLHIHTDEGAQTLDGLTGVAEDDSIDYSDGQYLRADGDSYESNTIQKADVPDYTNVSGDFLNHTGNSTVHFLESSIDHTNIQNVGTTTHSELDSVSGDFIDVSGDFSGHINNVTEDHTQYHNDSRANVWFSGLDTDDLDEGSSNKYFYNHDNSQHTTNYATQTDFTEVSGAHADVSGDVETHIANTSDPHNVQHSQLGGVSTDDHHTKYTDAEAVSAVSSDDAYIKNDANDVMSGDLTVDNIITAGNVDGTDVSTLSGDFSDVSGAHSNVSGDVETHIANTSDPHNIQHSQLGSVGSSDHHIQTAINDTPTNNETTTGASSNWAYDHKNNVNAHIDNITDITTRNHDDLNNKDNNNSFLHSTSAEQSNWNDAHSHSGITSGNPHSVSKSDVGLGNVPNTDIAYASTINLSGLDDVDSKTAQTVKRINDSGSSFPGDANGGELYWDSNSESFYRYHNSGYWIEIGSSDFEIPSLSGLVDVTLPSAGNIGDGTGLIWSDADGYWITGIVSTRPISDAAYGAGWNGITYTGASKNALYDIINPISGYAVDWDDSSGDLADYLVVSGDFSDVSGAHSNISGDIKDHLVNTSDPHNVQHSQLGSVNSDDHHTKYSLTDDLIAGEITQIQNINSVSITNGQWGYVGSMSAQPLESESDTLDNVADRGSSTDQSITTAGLIISTTNTLSFADGGSTDIIRDEDTLSSDDPNALATQQSIKAYMDNNSVNLRRIHLKKSAGSGENIVEGEANEIEVDWDNQEYIDSGAFTHSTSSSNHQITVDNDGIYRIICNMSYENATNSARNTPVAYIKINSSTINSTKAFDYDRGEGYGKYSNCKVITTLNLSANDIISIGTYAHNEDGTLSITDESCELVIEKLGYEAASNTWRSIDDTPVNGITTESISSNWAYDHTNSASAHHTKYALTDDLIAGEITQIQNINSKTISNTQWGYLGAMGTQPLESVDISADTNLTITSPITLTDDDIGLDQSSIAHSNINNDETSGNPHSVSASDVGLGSVEDIALSAAGWGDMGIATSDVSAADVGGVAYSSTIGLSDLDDLDAGGKITSVTDPTANQEAATKKYVDDNAGGASSLSDLSDVDNNLSGTITSLDDSGGAWVSGNSQGQIRWDEGVRYMWDESAGAWIQISAGSRAAVYQ